MAECSLHAGISLEQLGEGSKEFWCISAAGPAEKAEFGAWGWSISPSPVKGGSVKGIREESGQSALEGIREESEQSAP